MIKASFGVVLQFEIFAVILLQCFFYYVPKLLELEKSPAIYIMVLKLCWYIAHLSVVLLVVENGIEFELKQRHNNSG